MSKEEQIGKRLIDVMTKLEDLGVFYGKNYSGEYHEKYPHSQIIGSRWIWTNIGVVLKQVLCVMEMNTKPYQ